MLNRNEIPPYYKNINLSNVCDDTLNNTIYKSDQSHKDIPIFDLSTSQFSTNEQIINKGIEDIKEINISSRSPTNKERENVSSTIKNKTEPLKMEYSPTARLNNITSPYSDSVKIRDTLKEKSFLPQVLNSIFTSRTHEHICLIMKEYIKLKRKDLDTEVRPLLSDPYRHIIMTLMQSNEGMKSYILHHAIVEYGKIDFDTVIFVLVTHKEYEIEEINKQYINKYCFSIFEDIVQRTYGYLQKALVKLLDKKDKFDISEKEASNEARYIDKQGQMSDDMKEKMILLLCRSNNSVIYTFMNQYKQIYGKSLEDRFDQDDYFEKCLKSICRYYSDPARYFAMYINEGVQERNLKKISNVITLHYQTDMGHISRAYKYIFSVSITSEIESIFHYSSDSIECLKILLGEY